MSFDMHHSSPRIVKRFILEILSDLKYLIITRLI